MDELFRPEPGGTPLDREGTVHIDPLLARRVDARPWEVRAAQWRAWELAELSFGEGVRVALTGRRGSPPFRGMLSMTVPFRGLEDHKRREEVFLSWATADPILSRIPLIFLFQPEPVGAL